MFLVIDNYDSFVYNLVDYIHQHAQQTVIYYNDAVTVNDVFTLNPRAIFISPGPKRPEQAGFICDIIRICGKKIPILGICLGHQAIGHAFGADIIQSSPAHGVVSDIQIETETEIFKTLPSTIQAGRYHSLIIQENENFPSYLKITARTTATHLIMAVEHKEYPIYGVQFHPESLLTPEGLKMIGNFIKYAYHYNRIRL